jgi:hypothetical protein
MTSIVRVIDFAIDVFGAVMGHRPEPGFWRNVERILIVLLVLGLLAMLCVRLALAETVD